MALAAVAFFASAPGQSFFLSVFVDHLIADAGITRTTFSLLYAAATVVSATMVLNVGRAVDRWGARLVWIAVSAGLAAACVVLSTAAGVVAVLVALSFMRGFGQGSFPLLGTVQVASSFSGRRGSAMGLATQGITLGGVVMPALAVVLIDAYGWRMALRIVAAAVVVLVLPLGLRAAGRRGPLASGTRARCAPASIGQTLRRPGVVALLGVLAVPSLVTTAIVVQATSLLADHGLDSRGAALALSLMALATAGGALSAGVIADRFAPRWVLALIGAILTASTLLLLTRSAPLAYLAFGGLGLANGMVATANGTLWAGAYGTAGLGRLQGLAASARIAGAAAGPLPLAVVQSLTGGYGAGIIAMAGLGAVALIAGWRWHPPVEKTT